MPGLKDWFEGTFGANLQHRSPAVVSEPPTCVPPSPSVVLLPDDLPCVQPALNPSVVPPPNLHAAFLEALKEATIHCTHEPEDRVFHAHGGFHTYHGFVICDLPVPDCESVALRCF